MIWILWMALGCRTDVEATDFERSCSAPEDCLTVLEGDLCGFSCPAPAAIASTDADAYDTLRQRRFKNCSAIGFIGCPDVLPAATCDQGQCIVVSD